MVEDSETLTQSDKRHTRSTVRLTPGQALEILQQAAANCQAVGIGARMMPIYDNGTRLVAIVLTGVEMADDRLVVASTGRGDA